MSFVRAQAEVIARLSGDPAERAPVHTQTHSDSHPEVTGARQPEQLPVGDHMGDTSMQSDRGPQGVLGETLHQSDLYTEHPASLPTRSVINPSTHFDLSQGVNFPTVNLPPRYEQLRERYNLPLLQPNDLHPTADPRHPTAPAAQPDLSYHQAPQSARLPSQPTTMNAQPDMTLHRNLVDALDTLKQERDQDRQRDREQVV